MTTKNILYLLLLNPLDQLILFLDTSETVYWYFSEWKCCFEI